MQGHTQNWCLPLDVGYCTTGSDPIFQWLSAGGIPLPLHHGSHGIPILGWQDLLPGAQFALFAVTPNCSEAQVLQGQFWLRSICDLAACSNLVFLCRHVPEQPKTQCRADAARSFFGISLGPRGSNNKLREQSNNVQKLGR